MSHSRSISDHSDQNLADNNTDNNHTNEQSPWWHTPVSAGLGGATGGLLCFAAEGLKKRAQSGQPITADSFYPKELFRGSTSFATSVGITSIAQFTINRTLSTLPSYDQNSVYWNAGTAFTSGMVGAFFSTAVENIILQQQLKKTGPATAIRELFQQGYVRPWLGLPEIMMREAGFALLMLYLAKAVRNYVGTKTNNSYAPFASGIGLGVAGAIATHPFDTLATFKQKHLIRSSADAAKLIYNTHGINGFFKGVGYRAALFTGCMSVIPLTEEKVRSGLIQLSMFSPMSVNYSVISSNKTNKTEVNIPALAIEESNENKNENKIDYQRPFMRRTTF